MDFSAEFLFTWKPFYLSCLDLRHEADPPDPHQGQLPLRRSHQDCPQGAGRQQGTASFCVDQLVVYRSGTGILSRLIYAVG